MSQCDECGQALTDADKNSMGHYRDRCLDCMADAAEHRECTRCPEDGLCAVCRDKRERES